MVVIETNVSNVIPAICRVTCAALLDFGALARHAPRDHFEMTHVMAGWRLVALGALRRADGGMAEAGDAPALDGVARAALAAEPAFMGIAIGVATCAVEQAKRILGAHTEEGRGNSCRRLNVVPS
jgi:hypothetical protein